MPARNCKSLAGLAALDDGKTFRWPALRRLAGVWALALESRHG
jgi:hypothetical protein